MYGTKEMYGTDHSVIFSTQVNNKLYRTHYNVHVLMGAQGNTGGESVAPPAHTQHWTIEKMSRLAVVAPLGEGIAQPVIVI
jgi:hypothetical protein